MSLASGSRIGHYEIRGSIGSGGMGEVYRAHDPRLGRDVALKVLPEAMAKDPEGLERFTREARAVAALNHPHIVTLFSTEEAGGVRFMTMELIEGRTLDQMIPTSGLSLAQFFDVSMALADALSAAHQKQITHRDLKPANVMVSNDGRVKVLDFGLARATEVKAATLEEEATRQRLTQAGTILGTAPYMSPEQIEAKALDSRSDIFSLGIMMYEMATGGRPFRGETSAALMSSIMREHPRPASDLRGDLPSDVSQLIGRCMEKQSLDRIQTAQEILIELKAQRRAWESGASSVRPRSTSASKSSGTSASDFRIAVLPFAPRPAAGDSETLADGITEDVTMGLARFPYLLVVSRPDAEKAKGLSADARTADALKVRYLLDGTVRAAGDALRVSVRLVDSTTGVHLWAENYDRALKGGTSLFDLQDDLSSRIVATVADSSGVLTRSMASSVKERPIDELSVGELVLRYFSWGLQKEEHVRLRTGLERALATEPRHGLGWAVFARLWEPDPADDPQTRMAARTRCQQAAERSVEIDPASQFGWRGLAALHFYDRDADALNMAAERTIAINPLGTSVASVGMLLALSGDWDRGVSLVRRAMDLNPHHAGWHHLVTSTDHYRKHEYEEALAQAKRANMPYFAWGPLSTIAAAGQLGRGSEGRMAFDTLRKTNPAYLDPSKAREFWSFYLWEDDLVDRLVEGFTKAQALVESEPRTPSGSARKPDSSSSAPSASGRSASIAVLPFSDMSASKDQEWLCDGVAEEILNALSPLKGLRVAARASAFSFRGKGDDLKAIGDKLRVTTVLDGSVRRSGDKVRVTVRLSDVGSGVQLWSDRYDRDIKDIFDVQDEIAKAVAEKLRITLSGDEAGTPRVVRHTESQEAYHLYLRGRQLWFGRSRGNLEKALQNFEEAVAIDPNYALPYAGMADLFVVQALYGFEPEDAALPRARAAFERAIAINPDFAEARRAEGWFHLFAEWDLKRAVKSFEGCIELDPTSGLSHIWLGWPAWPGREEEAVAAARKAQQLDPLNLYVNSLAAAILDFSGHPDQGVIEGETVLELDPNYLVALYLTGGVYSRLGRHEDALRLSARGIEVSGRSAFFLSHHGFTLARAGRLDDARGILAELNACAQKGYVPALFRAVVHASLGELDPAFALLEEGVKQRNPWIGSPRMPMFDGFRADPRFAEHLRRIGHPDADRR